MTHLVWRMRHWRGWPAPRIRLRRYCNFLLIDLPKSMPCEVANPMAHSFIHKRLITQNNIIIALHLSFALSCQFLFLFPLKLCVDLSTLLSLLAFSSRSQSFYAVLLNSGVSSLRLRLEICVETSKWARGGSDYTYMARFVSMELGLFDQH